MIIPSIDLMNGRAVQLVHGKTKKLEAPEDPITLARQYGMTGEVAVIDLDAAMGTGTNAALIEQMLRVATCRVGGGIRSVEAAKTWLNKGAAKVILGTMAVPEILSQLPRERVIAAVDMQGGKVAVEGWKTVVEETGINRIQSLRDFVGGFLVTNIDIEGTMGGFDITTIAPILEAAGAARLTMAGGITMPQEIAALDKMGVDAQIGMALYTSAMTVADVFSAMLQSDRPDGLWPTVVVDENFQTLGLVYSNAESLALALTEMVGVYFSRRRGIWRKGETSGAVQTLLRIAMDCDRDSLCFVVQQQGRGFCHQGTMNCFGLDGGISALTHRIQRTPRDNGSYTQKLMRDAEWLNAKIAEEGAELAAASNTPDIIHEAADVLYFSSVKLAQQNISWASIWEELNRRSLKTSRQGGQRKDLPC